MLLQVKALRLNRGLTTCELSVCISCTEMQQATLVPGRMRERAYATSTSSTLTCSMALTFVATRDRLKERKSGPAAPMMIQPASERKLKLRRGCGGEERGVFEVEVTSDRGA